MYVCMCVYVWMYLGVICAKVTSSVHVEFPPPQIRWYEQEEEELFGLDSAFVFEVEEEEGGAGSTVEGSSLRTGSSSSGTFSGGEEEDEGEDLDDSSTGAFPKVTWSRGAEVEMEMQMGFHPLAEVVRLFPSVRNKRVTCYTCG